MNSDLTVKHTDVLLRRRLSGFIIMIAGALLMTLSTSSAAQANSNSWVLSCADNNDCRIGSEYYFNDTLVSYLLIYEAGDTEIFEVMLPLSTAINAGAYVAVGEVYEFPLTFLYCDLNGCVAYVRESEQLIQALLGSSSIRVHFTNSADGNGYHYPYSLDGFFDRYNEYIVNLLNKENR